MSTLTAVQHDALTDTYDDIKRLLYKIAHGFAFSRNVPFDELRSVADLAFVKACAGYSAKRGAKLSSWAAFVALCDIKTYLKRTHRYRHWVELNEEICGQEDHDTFLLSLRTELSADANMIVDLLVDSSSDMQTLLRWHGARRKLEVLRALREHLTDLGWEEERTIVAMKELDRTLTPKRQPLLVRIDPDLRRLGLQREDVWLMSRTGLSRTDVKLLLSK